MKFKTAYNHLKRFKKLTDSIYSGGKSYCSPHADILANMKKSVYGDPAYLKCPDWVRQIISERSSNHLENILRNHLIWRFPLADGSTVGKWDEIPENEKAEFLKTKTGKHYWLRPVYSAGKTSVESDGKICRTFEITDKEF